jgi:hypothetical protein
MYGDELQPTLAIKYGLEEAINKCLEVKLQKEHEIEGLTTTAPAK